MTGSYRLSNFNGHLRWVSYTGEPTPTPNDPEKIDKAPRNPSTGKMAFNNDLKTWGTRKQALARAASYQPRGKSGIGIELGSIGDLHLAGIDLDGCRNARTGQIEPWAAEVADRIGSYIEISPSGSGLKGFVLLNPADMPAIRAAMGNEHKISFMFAQHKGIEFHVSNSYYIVTDNEFGADPEELAVLGPDDALKTLSLEDVLWIIQTAGPALLMGGKAKRRDGSGSGALFRLAQKVKLRGGSKGDFEIAIEDDELASAHLARQADKQRAIDRAWERSGNADPFTDDDFSDLGVVHPATLRINQRFALARSGGSTVVVEFQEDGSLSFGSASDLNLWCANDLVSVDGKRYEAASKFWLRDTGRRQYNDIVFDPTNNAQNKNVLNLFQGWALEPNPEASCVLILAHILEVVCSGNKVHFIYVICWLADLFQNPGRKPRVALVLKGTKGAGKDTLAAIVKLIIGKRHVAHVEKPDLLTQRFNAHLASAILVHVEEAYWAGAADKKGVLQALITSETMTVERKGVDPVTVDSFCRIIMTTNERWVIPATNDERRYAVFEVSDARSGNTAYFDALYAEISNEGAAAFLDHLLSVNLTEFKVTQVPQTNALRDQKLASLSGVARFWFDLLNDGTLDIGDGDWTKRPLTVGRQHLRERYEHFIRSNKYQGEPVGGQQFGKELREILPSLKDKRGQGDNKTRPYFYIIPPLKACREEFSHWLKQAPDWDD